MQTDLGHSCIAPKEQGCTNTKISYFSMNRYVVGTHKKHLAEALLMSTHSKCFHGEIKRNIITFWLKAPYSSKINIFYPRKFE